MKNHKNLKDYPLVAFILTGITGAGKGTLVKFLMRLFPQIFAFSVSWTTRPRREGEIEGKHYFYRNHDQFSEHADKGGFFEWKTVYRSQKGSTGAPNKYGTPLSEIRRILGEGKIPLLDIDPKGALDVKKRFRNAHTVFITPHQKNKEAIDIARVRIYADANRDEPEARLEEATWELSQIGKFHSVLVNEQGRLMETCHSLIKILNGLVFKKNISCVEISSFENTKAKEQRSMELAGQTDTLFISQEMLYRYIAFTIKQMKVDIANLAEKELEDLLARILFTEDVHFGSVKPEGQHTRQAIREFGLFKNQIQFIEELYLPEVTMAFPLLHNIQAARDIVIHKMWSLAYGGKSKKVLVMGMGVKYLFPTTEPHQAVAQL